MTVKESWAVGQETSEKKKNYLAETGVHYPNIEEIKKKKKEQVHVICWLFLIKLFLVNLLPKVDCKHLIFHILLISLYESYQIFYYIAVMVLLFELHKKRYISFHT